MTRTHKWTIHEARADPHYFSRNGYLNADPRSTKKNGAGRGNWGQYGDELADVDESFNYKGLNRGVNAQEHEIRYKKIQDYEV